MIYRRSKKNVLAVADLHQNINKNLQKGFSLNFGKTFRHISFYLSSVAPLHKKKKTQQARKFKPVTP